MHISTNFIKFYLGVDGKSIKSNSDSPIQIFFPFNLLSYSMGEPHVFSSLKLSPLNNFSQASKYYIRDSKSVKYVSYLEGSHYQQGLLLD